jgi:hypothetical protein
VGLEVQGEFEQLLLDVSHHGLSHARGICHPRELGWFRSSWRSKGTGRGRSRFRPQQRPPANRGVPVPRGASCGTISS